jgi:hypothetical protein
MATSPLARGVGEAKPPQKSFVVIVGGVAANNDHKHGVWGSAPRRCNRPGVGTQRDAFLPYTML